MSRPDLGIAPWDRDVDAADLVDLETLANRIDVAKPLQRRTQVGRLQAEHLDVDVFGRDAQQPVTYPSADEQRSSAALTHGLSDLRSFELIEASSSAGSAARRGRWRSMLDVTATAVSPDDLVCEARHNGAENGQAPAIF